MATAKTTDNEHVKISLPARWVVAVAIPILATAGLTLQSTRAQPEVVERAILVHAQTRHVGAAGETDMDRVEFVQERMGKDVDELRGLVKELTGQMQELIIELRTRSPGGVL